jgi:hypothetical protein
MKTISASEYKEFCNDYMGFCTDCQDFTRECTEPDAEDYDCPECEQNTVVGTEQAMVLGLLDIED